MIPRFARYWFESAGEKELEILLVQAFAEGGTSLNSGRTDSAARKLMDAGAGPTFSAER